MEKRAGSHDLSGGTAAADRRARRGPATQRQDGGVQRFGGVGRHTPRKRVLPWHAGRVAFVGRWGRGVDIGPAGRPRGLPQRRGAGGVRSAAQFCPPAAVRLGIEPEQLVVVHPETAADADWAMDQALRSPDVAAVLAGRKNSMTAPFAVGNWRSRGRWPGPLAPAGGGAEPNHPGPTCGYGSSRWRAVMHNRAGQPAMADSKLLLRCRGAAAGCGDRCGVR